MKEMSIKILENGNLFDLFSVKKSGGNWELWRIFFNFFWRLGSPGNRL
jgi:hypothetical protein